MLALFHTRRYNNSKTARMMKNGVTKIGAALLDDPHLSFYKCDCLQTLLNKLIETLRQYLTGLDLCL